MLKARKKVKNLELKIQKKERMLWKLNQMKKK